MRVVRSRLRPILAGLAVIAGSSSFPSVAPASVISQTITGAATPTSQSATTFGGAALRIDLDAAYDSYDPAMPAQSGAVIHLDDDFAIDTTGLGTCDPGSIGTLSSSDAIAACPGAQVGSGTATGEWAPGPFPGTVTAFNGTPSGSDPTMVLHLDFGFGARIATAGVIGPSSRGGDFGTQLAFSNLGAWPGIALTHIDVGLTNQEPSPGHHPISARCNDADGTWNYAGDFSFADASTLQASDAQSCSIGGAGGAPAPAASAAPPKKKKKRKCKKARKGAGAAKKCKKGKR
jgi:hypothetical protein